MVTPSVDKSGPQRPAPISTGQPAARNIYEDPAISAAAKNDPVARFLNTNWKRIAVVLVAVGLGMVAYNTFNATKQQRQAAATGLFSDVRDRYTQIVNRQEQIRSLQAQLADTGPESAKVDKKESEERIKTLTKEVDDLHTKAKLMVASLDSPPPFDILGKLYGGMLAARFGDFETPKNALVSTQWEIVGRPGSSERLVAEMATLGLAKALLDAPAASPAAGGAASNGYLAASKMALTSLAERGEFAAVPAVSSLAAAADSAEERTKVAEIVASVRKRFPTQEKFLKEATELLAR